MSADAVQPLATGARLGQYVVCGPLGAGGMGEVYEAEDTRLHRHVALKVVRGDVAADPVRRARLEREASAVAKLNHSHIVTVYSLDEHDGTLFITMELVRRLQRQSRPVASRSTACWHCQSSWPTLSAPRMPRASCTAI